MSERTLRRRIPSFTGRKTLKPPPHPSPSPRRKDFTSSKTSSKQVRKSTPILKRCLSEPILLTAGLFSGGEYIDRNSESEFVLFRGHTCLDMCVVSGSSNLLLSQNPMNFEEYNKDAKVVVNVTVEGSPGPIRTMVRLGSSVDETIKLVVDKYDKEGRCPKLERSAVSEFELHHSHFSLQSLKRTDAMGDVGSRSFYLRKSNSNHSSIEVDHKPGVNTSSPSVTVPRYFLFLPDFISRKISKIMRRTQKVWKVLLHCGS